jgi:putative (di)nucleoside polyphosphate hydrolase
VEKKQIDTHRYRPGVCIVVQDNDSRLLVCRRVDQADRLGFLWQFPQGGIDPDLPLLQEAQRELREEIGTDAVRLIRRSSRRFCYDFPSGVRKKGYCGQCHWWLLVCLSVSEQAIHFDNQPAEFDAYQWVSPVQAINMVVPFKQQAYREALTDLGLL